MADKKIIETNKHLNTREKRVNRISKSVFASQRIEGVKISRKDAKHYVQDSFKSGNSVKPKSADGKRNSHSPRG